MMPDAQQPRKTEMNTTNPTNQNKSSPVALLLAILLLVTGVIAVVASVSQFLLGIVIPIAVIGGVGSMAWFITKHSLAAKKEALGKKVASLTVETISEATRLTGKTFHASTAAGKAFRQKIERQP